MPQSARDESATVSAKCIRTGLLLLIIALASVLASANTLASGQWIAWSDLNLRDTDGRPMVLAPSKWTVVCFLGTECPLARLYGPRLQKISDQYADRGVTLLGVNSNLQDSPAEIKRYAQTHGLTFAMAKDADQSVADALGAQRTPEVAIVDAAGWVRYQGRIDDQFEPGITRSAPTQNDLIEAIESLIRGADVKNPRTQSVGCLITRIEKPSQPVDQGQRVTFTRDVARVLNQHCVECHRDGEIAPFGLTDYDEVVGWAQMMLEVIDQQRMPPWHADPDVGNFIGQRRMPSRDRDVIARWIEQGMPEGDPGDLPAARKWPSGWHIAGSPDQEIQMLQPFRVSADGVIEYQYFVVDPGWKEDRWVRGAQVIPGDASVVHHAIVFVRPPDGIRNRGVGWVGAYVPGQRAGLLPEGHARRVPAGSRLIFQMHYTPNGRPSEDLTKVGVWFADPDAVTHEVTTRAAINHEFEIPPETPQHVVTATSHGLPRQGRLLGMAPHMHFRGKSFSLQLQRSDDSREPLLRVPHYDFNWQHWYALADPIGLDEVDTLHAEFTFDNSDDNPFNPDPQQYITWGDQTWEEMAIAFFDIATPRHAPREPEKTIPPSDQQARPKEREIKESVDDFLKKMDHDGDGRISRDEAPTTFRRFGFRQFDANRDGHLDRHELTQQAQWRF